MVSRIFQWLKYNFLHKNYGCSYSYIISNSVVIYVTIIITRFSTFMDSTNIGCTVVEWEINLQKSGIKTSLIPFCV